MNLLSLKSNRKNAHKSAVGFGSDPTRYEPVSPIDWPLLSVIIGLSLCGLVMIGSSSMPYATRHYDEPLFFVMRQSMFLGVSAVLGLAVFCVPTRQLERWGPVLLIFSLFLLCLVLVPGVGKLVNGSRRWLAFGPINVQVSEAVKLFIIIYLAGYLVRRGELVRNTWKGFVNPMVLVLFADRYGRYTVLTLSPATTIQFLKAI